jgi:hypothetical protein
MAVNSTVMVIVATGQEFQIPGDWSAEQLVQTYGANIQGLSSMQSSIANNGDVKTVTFSPRTGTKG